jgi:hypothetical protein
MKGSGGVLSLTLEGDKDRLIDEGCMTGVGSRRLRHASPTVMFVRSVKWVDRIRFLVTEVSSF